MTVIYVVLYGIKSFIIFTPTRQFSCHLAETEKVRTWMSEKKGSNFTLDRTSCTCTNVLDEKYNYSSTKSFCVFSFVHHKAFSSCLFVILLPKTAMSSDDNDMSFSSPVNTRRTCSLKETAKSIRTEKGSATVTFHNVLQSMKTAQTTIRTTAIATMRGRR